MSQHTRREMQPTAEQSGDAQPDHDGEPLGELVTAPWIGLHYRSEGP